MTSALRREQEDILYSTPDAERERHVVELKHPLKERELRRSTLRHCHRTTDVALSAATSKLEAYLKGLTLAGR